MDMIMEIDLNLHCSAAHTSAFLLNFPLSLSLPLPSPVLSSHRPPTRQIVAPGGRPADTAATS
jgi:hypothetical protein